MDFNKIRSVCRVIRIFIGVALIITGFVTGIFWFYLGIFPLLAGSLNFCPLCKISGKCDLPQNGES
jgi:hypothetical protein